jgi:hypothetical protein
VDRPWKRQRFRHKDVVEWAAGNRPALVWAALTLVRAWVAAGRPAHPVTLGSFERWAEVLGGILGVAAIPGFLANRDAVYDEADQEGSAWREFVAAWWGQYGGQPVRAADLLQLAEDRGLLDARRASGTLKARETCLGRALARVKDCVFDRLRVTQQKDTRTRSFVYALAVQAGADDPALRDGAEEPALRDGAEEPALREGGDDPALREGGDEPPVAPAASASAAPSGHQGGPSGPHADRGPDTKPWKKPGIVASSGHSGPLSRSPEKNRTGPVNVPASTAHTTFSLRPELRSRMSSNGHETLGNTAFDVLDLSQNEVQQRSSEVQTRDRSPDAARPAPADRPAANGLDW